MQTCEGRSSDSERISSLPTGAIVSEAGLSATTFAAFLSALGHILRPPFGAVFCRPPRIHAPTL
jgi:hypothetical protein